MSGVPVSPVTPASLFDVPCANSLDASYIPGVPDRSSCMSVSAQASPLARTIPSVMFQSGPFLQTFKQVFCLANQADKETCDGQDLLSFAAV